MLTVSYMHRAMEDVAGSQAQALLDKCWTIIAMLAPALVRSPGTCASCTMCNAKRSHCKVPRGMQRRM